MKTSPTGLALIQRFEGFSARAYRCPAGYWTIGYGHLCAPDHPTVSEAEAEVLLIKDVRIAERAVVRLISRALTQNQFDALVSFTFNLGSGALQRSRLRQVVNRGDDERVGQELLRWVYAGGKPLKGLVLRRQAEVALYALEVETDAKLGS
jgi:GH24 family phage-related lysozyme (muramidase)